MSKTQRLKATFDNMLNFRPLLHAEWALLSRSQKEEVVHQSGTDMKVINKWIQGGNANLLKLTNVIECVLKVRGVKL